MEVKETQGKRLTFGFTSKETINLGSGSVVGNDGETLVVDVQNEVLALLKAESWVGIYAIRSRLNLP